MILELLNKIKWDEGEEPSDYEFLYRDKSKLKALKYDYIVQINEGIMVCMIDDKLVEIPTHRIKKIYKKGEIILDRPMV